VIADLVRYVRDRLALKTAGAQVLKARGEFETAADKHDEATAAGSRPDPPDGDAPPGQKNGGKSPSPPAGDPNDSGPSRWARIVKWFMRNAPRAPKAAQDVEQNHDSADAEFRSAKRAWERAIGDWDEVAKTIKTFRHAPPNARGQVVGFRKRSPPPSEFILKRRLEEAEGEARHVWRALFKHLNDTIGSPRWIAWTLVALVLAIVALVAVWVGEGKGWHIAVLGVPTAVAVLSVLVAVLRTWFPQLSCANRWLAWTLLVVLLGIAIAGVVALALDDKIAWLAAVLGVAAVLTATNLLVALATTRFAWYGVTVFFSVLLFGSAWWIARTIAKPKVQPVALVRTSDDIGICGIYITQTSDRVYVGRLAYRKDRPGLIFWVPKSAVDVVSVGELAPTDEKLPKLAVAMLAQLYNDRAEEPAPEVKNTTNTTVKGQEESKDSPGTEKTTTVTETPVFKGEPRLHRKQNLPTTCTQPERSNAKTRATEPPAPDEPPKARPVR
jgi:hypothetical protein